MVPITHNPTPSGLSHLTTRNRISYQFALLALACLLVMAGTAQAIPFKPEGFNALFFSNAEVWIDDDSDDLISQGDYFWGTLELNQVKAITDNTGFGGGSTIWGPGAGPKEITGYFISRVSAVIPLGGGLARIVYAPISTAAEDANGIMTSADVANGVVLKMYEDNSGAGIFGNYNDGTQGSAVSTATDGSPLWRFTMGNTGILEDTTADTGYWFTNAPTNPFIAPTSFNGSSFAGLNIIENNEGGITGFRLVNDPNETLVDNDVHFWFNSEIEINENAQDGFYAIGSDEPMHFNSNDPAVYHPVPEPGALALLLLGGLALLRRRAR